jgi:hypothetical protein
MPQIFHRRTNTLSRLSIFGALFVAAGGLYGLVEANRSAYVTQVGVARDEYRAAHGGCQPFVRIDGDRVGAFDAVEQLAQAVRRQRRAAPGRIDVVPEALLLRDVGVATDTALNGSRSTLPDFVYFNHSVHVARAWAASPTTGASTR